MLSSLQTRQLDRLALSGATAAPGAGASHARTRGFGLEFEDYRHYQPGDDPRSIDWTVEARLRQLVVRVFRAEGHTRLHLLLDVSRSMTIGVPSKLSAAAALASALAYVAIERRDAVALATFDDRVRARIALATGKPQLFRTLAALEGARAVGKSAIDPALVTYAMAAKGPGLAVVISDFLAADHAFEGLKYLLYRGLTPAIVQVLADDDVDPRVVDDVEIADVEDPALSPVTVNADSARVYMERVAQLSRELEQFCLARGLAFVKIAAASSFDDVLHACVGAGLLVVHG